ncbi:penicillin-insensitive murein endopeptidase [Oceaniradius stylonematis]|uniref:penicillin-insensitive murein endopeptidase n=1 Tax=Oceaniradius stylonematis TaxID=2184161 RepID=UPI00273DE635|nr:penicillin-insensitive murein endopeptidase [Oceaniradius stylonematis]
MDYFEDGTEANDKAAQEASFDDDQLSILLEEANPHHDELGVLVNQKGNPLELPHHDKLKPKFKGMYIRYDSKCTGQHWGTEETVKMSMDLAYNWFKNNKTPTLLIGDISAKEFAKTKCHSAHKTGTHVDMDLAGTLPSDPGYDKEKRLKCAQICWLAIQLGVKRVLFSDAKVGVAVNKLAKDKGLSGRVVVRADHDDHFHIEMPI